MWFCADLRDSTIKLQQDGGTTVVQNVSIIFDNTAQQDEKNFLVQVTKELILNIYANLILKMSFFFL